MRPTTRRDLYQRIADLEGHSDVQQVDRTKIQPSPPAGATSAKPKGKPQPSPAPDLVRELRSEIRGMGAEIKALKKQEAQVIETALASDPVDAYRESLAGQDAFRAGLRKTERDRQEADAQAKRDELAKRLESRKR